MSNPLRACDHCGQSFWSAGGHAPDNACPACQQVARIAPEQASPVAPGSEDARDRPRFVTLSALPPEKRVLPRNDGTRPGLMVPRRLTEMRGHAPSLPVAPPRAETAPVRPEPLVPPVVEPPVPVAPPPVQPPVPLAANRQLGFNCPSCYTVLVIKDPGSYDGRAAPCPYCAVTIIPPRIAPPSPFTLVGSASTSAGALPAPRSGKWQAGSARSPVTPVEAEVA